MTSYPKFPLLVCLTLVLSLAIACDRGVDVVNGIEPVDDSLSYLDMDVFAAMTPQERGAYLRENHPDLGTEVVYFLRDRGRIAGNENAERVEFRFGALDDVIAESGDGNQYSGWFEDQLVAFVYVEGRDRPVVAVVECLNGLIATPEKFARMARVGDYEPVEAFVIEPGEGLVHHVGYDLAINLAERHDLPLYRGRRMTAANRITAAEARALEDGTDRLQVTVLVYEGDTFDLRTDRYIPSPRRPRA